MEKDEVVGLLGNNGAGKTTLMRILTTYMPASSGYASVAGFDVMEDSMEVRQRIESTGNESVGSTAEEFTAKFRADVARFKKIVQDAGIPYQD